MTTGDSTTTETEERNIVGEIRAWLASYTGYYVTTWDAKALIEFLKKSGWKEP